MIRMKMTAKDDNLPAFIQFRYIAPVIVENIITILCFNQKSTVMDVCYFHHYVLSSPYLESPIPAPTVYTSRMASFTTAST